jgi:alginate O-acetyltransferase complex protein AlgI
MSFVSISFIAFFAAVLLIYYLVPKRIQWVILLIASMGFYLAGGVRAALFIFGTTVLVYFGARQMQRVRDAAGGLKAAKKKNRGVLLFELLSNFGILLILKYYNFAAENIESLFGMFHWDINAPLVNMILPLGISFYTFQAIGYTIDVYKGKIRAEENFFKFALFISFFPQVTQGPISRYDQLAPQLTAEHPVSLQNLAFGAQLMLWGYFKKLVIADRAGIAVSQIFDGSMDASGAMTFLGMVLYAVQIYTDFAGGIDMTRGAAQMMGIDLIENFRQPYFGTSVADYWRRWHMSLTNWMRDYVFFPLTLSHFSNRIGKWGRKRFKKIGKQFPAYLPTFVTFLLIGIWHGAGWGFIAYGLYNSLIIIFSMAMTPAFKSWKKGLRIDEHSFGWRIFCTVRTFLIMVFGKTLTRAESVSDAFSMMKKVLTFAGASGEAHGLAAIGLSGREVIVLLLAIALLFTVSVLREKEISVRESLAAKSMPLRYAAYLGLLAIVLIFGVYGEGYSVSSFVYRNY